MTWSLGIILTLVTIIIGILGIGGGKMWGEKTVKEAVDSLDEKIMKLHHSCHNACKEARVAEEAKLAKAVEDLTKTIKEGVQPRLIVGNFIMDALAEKVGVSKETLLQIRRNVKNGTLKDI